MGGLSNKIYFPNLFDYHAIFQMNAILFPLMGIQIFTFDLSYIVIYFFQVLIKLNVEDSILNVKASVKQFNKPYMCLEYLSHSCNTVKYTIYLFKSMMHE